MTPFCCVEADGAYFKDIDGNRWLDCEMAMGSVIWGHSREEITQAVIEQVRKGTSYSIAADIEVELAEKILSRFNHYNAIRFCKSGADAVSAAVRISRLITKKQKVIYGTYHGWQDWSAYGYYDQQTDAIGIPSFIKDISIWIPKEELDDRLKNILQTMSPEISCLVVSPSNWVKEDLHELKKICQEKEIVLIFDEVSSGMRGGVQGVTGLMGVWPDILCISKGVANGMALAAVMADRKILNLSLQAKFSTAHSTECIAMAAAIASEKLMARAVSWPSWKPEAESMICILESQLSAAGAELNLKITGSYAGFRLHTPQTTIHTDKFRELFVKILAESGIFSTGYVLLSDKHTPNNVQEILNAISSAISRWSNTPH